MLSLIIPGPPLGKGRARTFLHRQSGRIVSMTPAKTVNAETLIKLTFAEKYPGHTPFAGPVSMDIWAFMPIPKSTSKKLAKLMESEKVPHVKKPDRSNIEKCAEDALNKIAYVDDSQIYRGETFKYYSPRPRLEIHIVGMDDLTAARCGAGKC